jgi:hypothetical protein
VQPVRSVVRAVLGALAAAACGAVSTAVPARLLMRLVAVAAGHAGSFSLVASAGIVVVFAMFATPGALLAALTAGRFRWALLAAGTLVLFVPATGIASDELGATHGFSIWRWVAVAASGGAVYLCIVALPIVVLRLVDRWR